MGRKVHPIASAGDQQDLGVALVRQPGCVRQAAARGPRHPAVDRRLGAALGIAGSTLNASEQRPCHDPHLQAGDRDRPQGRQRQGAAPADPGPDRDGGQARHRRDQGAGYRRRLVADNIAGQLERRISHRRAMQRAGAAGDAPGGQGHQGDVRRAAVGGGDGTPRLDARGRVPAQTLRADIDFAKAEALTTYGRSGEGLGVPGRRGPAEPEQPQVMDVYVSE